MSDNKKIIQTQLAKSVLEKGSVKCPSCASLVQWQDSDQYNPDGSKDRYFWCSNEECELHQKDVVKVSISKGFLQTFQQNFSKIGQGFIAAAFGALSMWGYSYLNGPEEPNEELVKQVENLNNEKEESDKKNDALTKQLADMQKQIADLANGNTNIIPIPSTIDNKVLDSLKNVIATKEATIKNLQVKEGAGQLSAVQMADLGIFYTSRKNRKSKEAKQYLFKALNHPNASFNDEEYMSIVGSLVELRTKLDKEEFMPLITEIEAHFPNNTKDVAQAKVYWYYADAYDDFKEYKKYKLTSLKHYLEGASKYTISQQDVNDGLKLIELYQLENIEPSLFNSESRIDEAFANQDKMTIRNFLEYGMKEGSGLFE